MPRTLSYTEQALDDLDGLRRWYTQPGAGPAAQRKLIAVLDAAEDLRSHPCPWPTGPHSGVRKRPCVGGWRALYRVTPDTDRDDTTGDVRVLRVDGPGQDRSLLRFER